MNPFSEGKRARVLVVDDHPAMREALGSKISRQPDLEICGEAADMAEALQKVAEAIPDMAVVDLSLKTGSGIDLIKRLKDRYPQVRILVCSMHEESLYAERSLRAGALGYINKDQATGKIIEAIRRVLEGKIYLSEYMAEKILHRSVGEGKKGMTNSPVELLADRELEVFRLIGHGVKTAAVAEKLHLSVKTVETYRNRIRQKLDLKDGTELAHFATQWILHYQDSE